MSFKIFKIDHFSITFKLNEKKEVLLKKIVWRGGWGYTKMFAEKEAWSLAGGLKIFFKKEGLDKEWVEKK